jgi:hypothetical protein
MKTTSAGNRMHIPEERMRRPTETETAIRAQKEELRKRIEHDPQLKKDFDFQIAKTGLQPKQLLTGLWLDCNMMNADRQKPI